MLNEGTSWNRIDAAVCLARIGPSAAPALPALLTALQTTNMNSKDYQSFRYWTLFALGEIGPAAKSAIPQLATMTNDVSAKLALMKIKGESLQSFMEQLKETSDSKSWTETAWLVGSMGTNGEPAIPLLLKVIANTNRSLQPPAIGALGEIHRQPDLCVPAIIPFLRSTNLNHRRMAVYAIRNFGEAAKPAVPDILRCLNDPDGWIQQQATNALRIIDPVTAVTVLGKTGEPK
jgi:HEAT repeat protein